MSTIELASGSATMTARADYLLVVEHGTLASGEEALRYVTELELAAQRYQLRRLLVDARSEVDEIDSRGDARGAMWRWIRTQRVFDMIGYVLRDEMTIARVNMTALSERLPVRAFAGVAEGHRWLAKQRASSTAIPASRPTSSSVPPPPMRTPMPPRASMPTPPDPRAATRQTARQSTLSSQEAEALLSGERRMTTPPGATARTTVKIAAVDADAADDILSSSPSRKTGEIVLNPSRKTSR